MDRFGKLPLTFTELRERLQAGQEYRFESHDLQYRLWFQDGKYFLQQGNDVQPFLQLEPALFTLLDCIGEFFRADVKLREDAHKRKSIRFINAMIEYTLTEMLGWLEIQRTPQKIYLFATQKLDFPLTEQEVEEALCRRYARVYAGLSRDQQFVEQSAKMLPDIRAVLVRHQVPVPEPFLATDMSRVNWQTLGYRALREIANIFAYNNLPDPLYTVKINDDYPHYTEKIPVLLKDGSVIEGVVYDLSPDGQTGLVFHFDEVQVIYRGDQWIERSVLEEEHP